jgi:hypothetical protein
MIRRSNRRPDYTVACWTPECGPVGLELGPRGPGSYPGQAAFTAIGDWTYGELAKAGLKENQDFGWVSSAGTEGAFLVVADGFIYFAKGDRTWLKRWHGLEWWAAKRRRKPLMRSGSWTFVTPEQNQLRG